MSPSRLLAGRGEGKCRLLLLHLEGVFGDDIGPNREAASPASGDGCLVSQPITTSQGRVFPILLIFASSPY